MRPIVQSTEALELSVADTRRAVRSDHFCVLLYLMKYEMSQLEHMWGHSHSAVCVARYAVYYIQSYNKKQMWSLYVHLPQVSYS